MTIGNKELYAFACEEVENINSEIESIRNGTRKLKKRETKKGLIEALDKKKSMFSIPVMHHITEHIRNSGLEPVFFNYLKSALENGDLVALNCKSYSAGRAKHHHPYLRYKTALMVRYYVSNKKKGDRNSIELVRYKMEAEGVHLGKTAISRICTDMNSQIEKFIKSFNPNPETMPNGRLRIRSMPSNQEIMSYLKLEGEKAVSEMRDKGQKKLEATTRRCAISVS